MKTIYVAPVIEIVKFQETEIEMDGSTQDVMVNDWFGIE